MSIKSKKIVWEHWNTKEEESLIDKEEYENNLLNSLDEVDEGDENPQFSIKGCAFFEIPAMSSRTVITPFGVYYADSMLKPSDRWDCWIGYTNFSITEDILNILDNIEGVESLKILGRYTFCIGVAKLFNIADVRQDIETQLCEYTNEEILSIIDPDTKSVVYKIKQQIEDKKFWSIFIHENGNVDYTMSDDFDDEYKENVRKFERVKSQNGGFILRSEG
jgi:hypothetical protein